jgi:hypothetical protein
MGSIVALCQHCNRPRLDLDLKFQRARSKPEMHSSLNATPCVVNLVNNLSPLPCTSVESSP